MDVVCVARSDGARGRLSRRAGKSLAQLALPQPLYLHILHLPTAAGHRRSAALPADFH